MKFLKMLEMLLKETDGKDKMLLRAEVNAFLKDTRIRKSLEAADYDTRSRLIRELEAILGKPVDLEEYTAEQVS